MDRRDSSSATIDRSTKPSPDRKTPGVREDGPERDHDDDVIMTAFAGLNLNLNLDPPAGSDAEPSAPTRQAASVQNAAASSSKGVSSGQREVRNVAGKLKVGHAAATATSDQVPAAPGVPGVDRAPGKVQSSPPTKQNDAPTSVLAKHNSGRYDRKGQHTGTEKKGLGDETRRDTSTKKRQRQATGNVVPNESASSQTASVESNSKLEHSRLPVGARVEGSALQQTTESVSNRDGRLAQQGTRGCATQGQKEGSTTCDAAEKLSRPKRSRDEEPPTESSPSAHSGGSDRPSPGNVGMACAPCKRLRISSEPLSNKRKATASESNPSQTLVSARSRYRIVRHTAISTDEKQSVPWKKIGSVSPAGQATDDRGSPKTQRDLPQRVSVPPTDKDTLAQALSVVIDGSNAAFAYREGGGRWFAQGPLLALKFFEQRGVKGVAFVPRIRMRSVSPEDDYYQAFQEAKASGAISMVPAQGNDDLFILKHAIDKKAYVVTNDQFRDHAESSKTLAALGQTKSELRAYLAHYHVSFAFARDEFVPNPEAPLSMMLTQQASERRREKDDAHKENGDAAKSAVLP